MTGKGKFTDDCPLPKMLHPRVLRAGIRRAIIWALDVSLAYLDFGKAGRKRKTQQGDLGTAASTAAARRLISRSGAPLRIFAALDLTDVIGLCPSYGRDRGLAEGPRPSEDSCLQGRAFSAGVVVERR